MDNYEEKIKENIKRNKKFIKEFKKWLRGKNLSDKTIKKHVSNVEFYLDDFLNYYDITKMEDGCSMIDDFLGDWFIRKCMWSSKTSIKENAASIKKFYQCMNELGYVSYDSYNNLCFIIKEHMKYWLEEMDIYENEDDYYFD